MMDVSPPACTCCRAMRASHTDRWLSPRPAAYDTFRCPPATLGSILLSHALCRHTPCGVSCISVTAVITGLSRRRDLEPRGRDNSRHSFVCFPSCTQCEAYSIQEGILQKNTPTHGRCVINNLLDECATCQ